MGMRLQLSYFILFFSLVFCSSCPLDYLPGQIIGCFNHEPKANDQSVHDQIQTECAVRYQNISKVYVCINNQWVGKIGNVKADHKIAMLLLRHKRFLGDLWKFLFGSRPRDNSPPSLKCPEVQPLLAEPLQSYARVFWKEPVYALDDRDGWLIANQISGKSSGSYFTEDEWPVKYIAKDKVGNLATCVIPIYVKVVKCQTPSGIKNGYFRCNAGSVFLLGSNCEYGCYGGFDLIGKSQLTCTREGIWSAPTPACSPWQCPHLPNINGAGFPSCTDGQSYRSICEYTCEKPGYDMPPLVGKTLICSEDKTWHHVGTPICVDVEPPVFETCPSTLVYGTERSSNKSLVTWIEPTASDNSGEPVHVYLVRGHKPDTRLSAGQYDIIYGVRDQTGNTGNECGFSVIVRDIRCPMIYPTPYTRVSCPDGTRTGALCAISCEPGKKLLGIDSVSCEQTMDGLFGVWNWKNDTQSFCENTLQCTPLEPPKSGAIACDNWLGGEFCQAQCQNGTEMPNVDLNGLYVCDDVGNWIPPPMFKACQAIHIPIQQSTLVNAAVTFDGDCSTLKSQRQIAENFIYQLQHSIFFHPEVCPDNTDCNPDNVQISCGEVDRRRRSAYGMPLYVNKTHVSVQIRLYLPTMTDDIQDARIQYQTVLSNVQRFVSYDAERIFGDILVHDINVEGEGIITHCDLGTVVSEDGLRCVECPAGTYFYENMNSDNSDCYLCQKGFYQDQARQTNCKRCPVATTTKHIGTQDRAQCRDACPVGMFSSDGLPPCSPCYVGFYQSEYGQVNCTRCPAGMTTKTFGSGSIADCSVFDLMFDGDNTSSVFLSFKEAILSEFTMTMWIRLSELTDDETETFEIVLLGNDTGMQWGLQENSIFSKRKISKLGIVDGKWHHVVVFNKNCSMDFHLDGAPLFVNITESPCEHLTVSKIRVTNGGGRSVSLTQLNIWDGIRNVKMNRSCLNSEEGTIIHWQAFDAAILDGTFTTIPSQCDDLDECFSMPCIHGVCKDMLHDFICTCNSGFNGKQCDVNIDDCETNVCLNGATCIDGVSNYTCRCADSYTGEFCEIFMVDGQWNKWGNWSECSTSCGEGHMIRTRLCNNPLPDNGGKYCPGSDVDFIACTPLACPVCPEFVAPMNGSVECINTSDTINCTIFCDAGFDFDIAPMQVYTCGLNTGNVWNYQTSVNPQRRLPKCTEIAPPLSVEVTYSIRYKSVPCSPDTIAAKAHNVISKQAKLLLSRVSCVAAGTCKALIPNVTTCSNDDIANGSTAGVKMTLKTTDLNETYVNDIIMLEDAVNVIQDAVENGHLNVDVGGETYTADLPKSKTVGNVYCRSGQTAVSYYCVTCGSGSYSTNDTCVPCPVGQYQDSEGQLTCLFCPSGSITVGEGSDSLSDCSDANLISKNDNTWILGTGIGVGCGLLALIVVAICCFVRYKSKQRKYRQESANVNQITIRLPRSPDNKMQARNRSGIRRQIAGRKADSSTRQQGTEPTREYAPYRFLTPRVERRPCRFSESKI